MRKDLLGYAFLLLAGSATAQLHSGRDVVGPVPAATLLIPYFEVDVGDDACATSLGRTTLFSVSNAAATTTLAHVTLWSDQAVPVFVFDVYLTGYDVQTLNLRDVLCNGNLPSTGSAVSNRGAFSDEHATFPSCNNTTTTGSAPVYGTGFLAAATRAHLKAWLTGNPSPMSGDCAGSKRNSSIAIGYVTIDQTQDCSTLTPADAGYFAGIAGFDNVLFGDYFLIDDVNNFSQGFSAVAIEAADPANPYTPGDHTFYGRYIGATAIDQREVLPTTTAARFATGGAFDSTAFYVWRESNQSASPYDCDLAGPSSWYPLGFSNNSGGGAVIFFDEQENAITTTHGLPTEPGLPFLPPNASNAVEVGPGGDYDTGSFNFGWVYQNLQHGAIAPIYFDIAAQQSTVWTLTAAGRFSVGLDAVQLDTANAPILGNPSEVP